jgi:hypothetical protein
LLRSAPARLLQLLGGSSSLRRAGQNLLLFLLLPLPPPPPLRARLLLQGPVSWLPRLLLATLLGIGRGCLLLRRWKGGRCGCRWRQRRLPPLREALGQRKLGKRRWLCGTSPRVLLASNASPLEGAGAELAAGQDVPSWQRAVVSLSLQVGWQAGRAAIPILLKPLLRLLRLLLLLPLVQLCLRGLQQLLLLRLLRLLSLLLLLLLLLLRRLLLQLLRELLPLELP